MRGLRNELKRSTLALALMYLASGCAKSDENVADVNLPAGTGQALNPSGQARTPDEQQMIEQRRRAGDAMGANMARAAEQMKEARERSGGK